MTIGFLDAFRRCDLAGNNLVSVKALRKALGYPRGALDNLLLSYRRLGVLSLRASDGFEPWGEAVVADEGQRYEYISLRKD